MGAYCVLNTHKLNRQSTDTCCVYIRFTFVVLWYVVVYYKRLKNEVDTSLVSEDTYSYLTGTSTVWEQAWYCRVHILRCNVSH